jgi:transposase
VPADVRQATVRPAVEAAVAGGAPVRADGHGVRARPDGRGRRHRTVRHARGGHARDGDGDGSRGVRADTAEGPPPLPRPRPRRGTSREGLPARLALLGVVHDARRRGGALPGTLVAALVAWAEDHHPGTLDLPPESGGVGSERHAAARMPIPPMLARASAGVR